MPASQNSTMWLVACLPRPSASLLWHNSIRANCKCKRYGKRFKKKKKDGGLAVFDLGVRGCFTEKITLIEWEWTFHQGRGSYFLKECEIA